MRFGFFLLGLNLDLWTQPLIEKAVSSFGRLLIWEEGLFYLSRAVVKVRINSLEDISWYFVFTEDLWIRKLECWMWNSAGKNARPKFARLWRGRACLLGCRSRPRTCPLETPAVRGEAPPGTAAWSPSRQLLGTGGSGCLTRPPGGHDRSHGLAPLWPWRGRGASSGATHGPLHGRRQGWAPCRCGGVASMQVSTDDETTDTTLAKTMKRIPPM
jgi:hypothetical protein